MDWTLEVVNGAVTLRPSVGNWSLPCRSHYLIRQNKVVWARDMSHDEIERGRINDHQLRDTHFAEVNRRKGMEKDRAAAAPQPASWFARLRRALRRWVGRAD